MTEMKQTLIKYRLEQAQEALDAAQILFDQVKYRSSLSRSYYAMFYGVLALLANGDIQASKHTGAIALFDKEFVKTEIFKKEFSLWLHEAFDLRQRADYREMFEVSAEITQEVLGHARTFFIEINNRLK
jgi:uncharacterized protein (UPF0332 family)